MAKKNQAAQPGDSAAVYLRLDSAMLERLDAFAGTLDGQVSRASAARHLIATALDGGAPQADAPRFKVGDRVATTRQGEGVVTDGPIHSVVYVVAFDEAEGAPPRVNERVLKPA